MHADCDDGAAMAVDVACERAGAWVEAAKLGAPPPNRMRASTASDVVVFWPTHLRWAKRLMFVSSFAFEASTHSLFKVLLCSAVVVLLASMFFRRKWNCKGLVSWAGVPHS